MKKTLIIAILCVAVFTAAVFLMQSNTQPASDQDTSTSYDHIDVIDHIDGDLNENTCLDAGGTWNACGSACRANPDGICIEVCVEYCECKSDDQCPESFVCADYVDDIGVCEILL